MSTKNHEEDPVIKSKNGFSFKRKRQEEIVNENPLQKLKSSKDQLAKDQPPISIKLKNPILPKDLQISFSENDINSNKAKNNEVQAKKSVQINGKLKENDKSSKNKVLKEKDKNIKQEESDEEEEEIQPKKAPSIEPVLSKEIVIHEKSLVKLPPYPLVLLPLEFEYEVYEKENPYKRLSRMVSDICSKEEAVLKIEYKDYTFFLKIFGKFVKRLNFDVDNKLESALRERTSSNKVLKENLQNVFERQKRKVLEKLIYEYSRGNNVLIEFQEASINKGKLSETVESYVRYIKNENRLYLDSSLSKRIESQRDEIEKKVTQKIKSSFQELNNHEKQMANFYKEISAIENKIEQQKKKAYNKIFKEYIPIMETDPSDLMRNFLTL